MANGLTDKQQAFLSVLAYTLGSLGSVTAVLSAVKDSEIGLIAGVIVAIAGAISIGIKEGLGLPANGVTPSSVSTPSQTPSSTAPSTSTG